MNKEMPDTILLSDFNEGEANAIAFSPGMGDYHTRYTNTSTLIERVKGMKENELKYYTYYQMANPVKIHNAALDAVIKEIGE